MAQTIELSITVSDTKAGTCLTLKQKFITFWRNMSVVELETALKAEGYKLNPDFDSLKTINKASPFFAEKCPNGTYQKNNEGKYLFVRFFCYGGRWEWIGDNNFRCDAIWFPVSELVEP